MLRLAKMIGMKQRSASQIANLQIPSSRTPFASQKHLFVITARLGYSLLWKFRHRNKVSIKLLQRIERLCEIGIAA